MLGGEAGFTGVWPKGPDGGLVLVPDQSGFEERHEGPAPADLDASISPGASIEMALSVGIRKCSQ